MISSHLRGSRCETVSHNWGELRRARRARPISANQVRAASFYASAVRSI